MIPSLHTFTLPLLPKIDNKRQALHGPPTNQTLGVLPFAFGCADQMSDQFVHAFRPLLKCPNSCLLTDSYSSKRSSIFGTDLSQQDQRVSPFSLQNFSPFSTHIYYVLANQADMRKSGINLMLFEAKSIRPGS